MKMLSPVLQTVLRIWLVSNILWNKQIGVSPRFFVSVSPVPAVSPPGSPSCDVSIPFLSVSLPPGSSSSTTCDMFVLVILSSGPDPISLGVYSGPSSCVSPSRTICPLLFPLVSLLSSISIAVLLLPLHTLSLGCSEQGPIAPV